MWSRNSTRRQERRILGVNRVRLPLLAQVAACLLVWLAVTGCAPAPTSAPAPALPGALDVTTVGENTSLVPYLAWLRDPSGQLTAADVAASGRFTPFGAAVPNFGFSEDTVWVRLVLTNPSSAALPLVLHLDAPSLGFVDLYAGEPAGGQQPLFSTGALRPYSSRPLPGRAFAFPITVPAEADAAYWLHTASAMPINLALTLWQPEAFRAAYDADEIAWGIVLGMLLLMTAYNLLLFAALRERTYLVLATFGLLVACSAAISSGYAGRWFPPAPPEKWLIAMAVSTALVVGAFALLALTFLDLHGRLRIARYILHAVLALMAAATLIALAGWPRAALILSIGLLFPLLLVTFGATVVAIRQGQRMAVFLLLGQAIPIVSGLAQALSIFGIGPKLPVLPLLVPVNSLLLLLIMSLALADRVNHLRRAAGEANAALQASEQRLRTYLDALPFNVQVHDAQLKPLYVNAQIRQTEVSVPEGWFEEQYEVWVRGFPVFISGTDQPYPVEQLPLMRAARGEKAHSDDVDVQTPAGRKPLESWAVPLFDETGAISAIVTAFQDISRRRATENELASYREHLEQRVTQRTAELASLNANLTARVTELTAINEVSRRVTHIGDLRGTLDEVAQILAEAFQAAGVAISLFDAARQQMEVIVLADRSAGALAHFADLSFAYAADSYTLRSPNATVFADPSDMHGLPPDLRGELAASGIQPVLLAPLIARDAPIGALVLMSNEAKQSFSASEVRVLETIAGQVATAIDTVRLLDEVRRQRDVAEALRQTATALSRNLDQQNVLGAILEQLDQVFAAEGAAVALVEGDELVTAAATGLSEASIGQRTGLDGESAAPSVLRSRKALLIEDTHKDGAAALHGSPSATRCWLGAPLISGENAIGVLSLDSTTPRSFTQAQANLLGTFADQAAIAVTNAHLYNQAQALAVVGERNRIARDLHDAVTQTIFSASLIAATLPPRLPALPPEVRTDIEALQMLTTGALAEMRTLLLELRPERLSEAPLDVLLGQLAQAFAGRNGVPAQVDANCDPHYAPPYAVKIAFYRVAQEALNNVSKHAKAGRVTIRYSARTGALRLAVIDDGQGFDLHGIGPAQMGLAIMRERAAAVGAHVTVDSEPGLGTHLFMVWNAE